MTSSEKTLMRYSSSNAFVSDVAATVNLAKSPNPGLPVFVLGHSAGGVVSSVYVLESQAGLAGFAGRRTVSAVEACRERLQSIR